MGDGPQPIEVEIVDGDRGRQRSEQAPAGPVRRRSNRAGVVTVAAAAVIAGTLGLAVGRASVGDAPRSGDDERAADEVGDGGDAPDVATTQDQPTDPVVEPIPPVPTTVPVQTMIASGAEVDEEIDTDLDDEIEPPASETTTIRLDPRLEGIDARILAPRRDGAWMRLDLADGSLDVVASDAPENRAGQDLGVAAGEGWFVVSGAGGGPGTVVWRDATATWERVDMGLSWQLLREADTDRFWRQRDPSPGSETVLALVDLDGSPVGSEITVPAGGFVIGSDPAGGVIVAAGGRLFSVSADGRTPLGGGDPLAVDRTSYVTWWCDDDLRCGVAITDRATGDMRRIDGDGDDPLARGQILGGFGFGLGDLSSALSPDGSYLVVFVGVATGLEMGLVDLRSGDYRRIAGADRPSVVTWTPGGRYLLYVDRGAPTAFDPETGERFAIDPGGELAGSIDVVAVR